MVVLGIDAHKRSHTVAAVDAAGRLLATKTVSADAAGHLLLVRWAGQFGERRFAVEDCRPLSRRLEADLLAVGERIARVPPKLMAKARDSARSYGKSDPIDALAVARAALREPDLPTAVLDGPPRQLRLLVDHRAGLVAERTRVINQLRWHIHEINPDWQPPARSAHRPKHLTLLRGRLADATGLVAELAGELAQRCAQLTVRIGELDRQISEHIAVLAPTLLALPGCGSLTAARIVAQTADITRFRSQHAYARHNGSAPVPVWSGNQQRHRLSRIGNRQLNSCLHTIAITQLSTTHPAGSSTSAASPTETPAGKPCGCSNDAYPTSSIDASKPTPRSAP
ncbi:IS110 family transposase [Hamadaea flava]|uniref:IS110 family transposase n=1 Tax=Hamadaea flava TaxID=1742688 RepID=UPI0023DF946C|nr:IS110 family transposase [Hamadaea flava]